MRIEEADVRSVSRLMGELSEFPAAQATAARAHCFAALARIVGAENVFWVPAMRVKRERPSDQLGGWKPMGLSRLHQDPRLDRCTALVLSEIAAGRADPLTLANTRRAGTTRALLRAELVPDAEWERCPHLNEALRPSGVADRLVGAHTVDDRRESYIGLDRGPQDRPFGERERDLLRLFLLGAPAFHREQVLAEGLVDPALSPRERQVLALLLTDMNEREIGRALGLTWRTTHQYAASIFRKFGVRGRIGLMAHWLRSGVTAPPAS
jgi:DNA-binding CsgD family transcriptional regulator